MKNGRMWAPIVMGAVLAGNIPASADVTADALLKVLVRKGVLTQAEADAVRSEAEQETVVEVSALQKAQADTARQVASLKATVDKAARTTFSGYIQARATIQENGTPRNNIAARRARVSATHVNGPARFRFTLDGGQNDVTVKDAWLSYTALPGRDGRGALTLQLGQFLRPFGFEVERSSSVREFPERPAGWITLFPGYYDQGANAAYALTADTTLTLALMNGTGSGNRSTPSRDADDFKDVLARVRHTVRDAGEPKLDLALSAYMGRQRTAGATVITGDRDRYGIAAVAHGIAGGEARGEYIRARDLTANLADGPGLATAPAEAWYMMYLHPVGSGVSLGARYDVFDPDTRDDNRLGGDGEVETLGFVALRDLTENVRLTLAYERPRTTRYSATTETSAARTDDVLTLQGQYKF